MLLEEAGNGMFPNIPPPQPKTHSHIILEWLRVCALESDSMGTNPVPSPH